MEDRAKFDRSLQAPIPGRARTASVTGLQVETRDLRAMAQWAAVAQGG